MKLRMEFECINEFAASATETQAGYFVIISRQNKGEIELVCAQNIEIKGKIQTFLRSQISQLKGNHGLDSIALRSNISSAWGSILTEHIFRIHDHLRHENDTSDVVAYTAWCYTTLINWGEASAARELALKWDIPVRTIQNRLRLARERGILKSPGQGSRLGG